MDRETLINEHFIFESKMETTYTPSFEIQDQKLEVPPDIFEIFKSNLANEKIFLDDDNLIREIITGLIRGNIILQGPPGTGKTTIAKIICDTFNIKPIFRTAIDDWTTYDTIGGYFPSVDENGNEIIVGKNGKIIDSVVECCNTILEREYGDYTPEEKIEKEQASWLIIDELNRAEIDKTFGDMFTVLGSSDPSSPKTIHLDFQNSPAKKDLAIPNRYRIIGLMNNIDKNFVYDLSQGLSRRFQFITIMPTENMESELGYVKSNIGDIIGNKITNFSNQKINNQFVEEKFYNDDVFKNFEDKLLKFLKHIRLEKDEDYLGFPLGTAQIKDVYENIIINMLIYDYASLSKEEKEEMIKIFIDQSVSNMIMPQLENFDFDKKISFYEYLSKNAELNWLENTKKRLFEMIN